MTRATPDGCPFPILRLTDPSTPVQRPAVRARHVQNTPAKTRSDRTTRGVEWVSRRGGARALDSHESGPDPGRHAAWGRGSRRTGGTHQPCCTASAAQALPGPAPLEGREEEAACCSVSSTRCTTNYIKCQSTPDASVCIRPTREAVARRRRRICSRSRAMERAQRHPRVPLRVRARVCPGRAALHLALHRLLGVRWHSDGPSVDVDCLCIRDTIGLHRVTQLLYIDYLRRQSTDRLEGRLLLRIRGTDDRDDSPSLPSTSFQGTTTYLPSNRIGVQVIFVPSSYDE